MATVRNPIIKVWNLTFKVEIQYTWVEFEISLIKLNSLRNNLSQRQGLLGTTLHITITFGMLPSLIPTTLCGRDGLGGAGSFYLPLAF